MHFLCLVRRSCFTCTDRPDGFIGDGEIVRGLYTKDSLYFPYAEMAENISRHQPDLLVAPLADYDTSHPAEPHLVIEVAESSLAYDRSTKRRLYAEQRVPEYWIVDIDARTIARWRTLLDPGELLTESLTWQPDGMTAPFT